MGGKNIQSGMVATVENFAKELISRAGDLGFSKHLAYFDQDYNNLER